MVAATGSAQTLIADNESNLEDDVLVTEEITLTADDNHSLEADIVNPPPPILIDSELAEDGIEREYFPSPWDADLAVPLTAEGKWLHLYLRGGDGGFGRATAGGTFYCSAKKYAGVGGLLDFSVQVGFGDDQIPPGSIIRLIVGDKGKNQKSAGSAQGGGGGGTAVLYRRMEKADNTSQWQLSSDWKVIAVAGGGSGSSTEASVLGFVDGGSNCYKVEKGEPSGLYDFALGDEICYSDCEGKSGGSRGGRGFTAGSSYGTAGGFPDIDGYTGKNSYVSFELEIDQQQYLRAFSDNYSRETTKYPMSGSIRYLIKDNQYDQEGEPTPPPMPVFATDY